MDLVVKGYKIKATVSDILRKIRDDSNGEYLGVIDQKDDYVAVTCPFHKGGKEIRPSCSVFSSVVDSKVQCGVYHCLACGAKGYITNIVDQCLGLDGEEYILSNFTHVEEEDEFYIDDLSFINEEETAKDSKIINDCLLQRYEYDNKEALDYLLNKRHLRADALSLFSVGFNPRRRTITFPVWDEIGNLVAVSERNIDNKKFYIPGGIEKPVYGLDKVHAGNHETAFVCESQINALTLWGWGYPAVALFGTGSSKQIDILKNSGLTNFILCLDGDEAGDRGAENIRKALCGESFVYKVNIPRGKDVNDLTKEEFDNLLDSTKIYS